MVKVLQIVSFRLLMLVTVQEMLPKGVVKELVAFAKILAPFLIIAQHQIASVIVQVPMKQYAVTGFVTTSTTTWNGPSTKSKAC